MPEPDAPDGVLAPIVLASRSAHRLALLRSAGIDATAIPATIDERAVEEAVGGGLDPADLAGLLAETKAVDVSPRAPGAVVIGADQTLELDGEVLHKVADMEAARRRLLLLSGRTHRLHSAVVLARDGRVLWRGTESAAITFRDLTPGEVGRNLAMAGADVLGSVGAYQIEGVGIRLVERIEGHHSTIVGLPMLPLLAALREHGAIEGFGHGG